MEILDGRYYGNGDKNLFLKISGNGKFPIIIEPTWGSLSVEWEKIQAELSKHTCVISYDRAGYGESPTGVLPRTSGQIADELYVALKNSEIPGPYILLGHGSGGLYCQHFLKLFANDVAGLILVDSMSVLDAEIDKLDLPNYKEIMSHQRKIQNFNQYLEMEEEEFESLIIPLLNKVYAGMEDELKEILITYQSDINFYKTTFNEMSAREASIEMLNQLSLFTNIPVKILCRDFKVMIELSKNLGIPEEEARLIEETWFKSCKDLQNLSTETELQIVKGAGHFVHFDNPQAIVQATLDILNKCLIEVG